MAVDQNIKNKYYSVNKTVDEDTWVNDFVDWVSINIPIYYIDDLNETTPSS